MSSDRTLLPVGGAPAAGLTDALTSAAGYALNEKATRPAAHTATTSGASRPGARRSERSRFSDAGDRCGLSGGPRRFRAQGLDNFATRGGDRVAHKLASFEPPINESVKAVMRGIRRKLGTAQKGKASATAAVVAKLVKLIPDDLSGKRDRVLILIGFAAALRRSELVALTLADVERAPDGIVLHIRQSKTDQDGQGDLEAVTQGPIFRRNRRPAIRGCDNCRFHRGAKCRNGNALRGPRSTPVRALW
jgi:integrase